MSEQRLAELIAEEKQLHFRGFDAETAWALGSAIRAKGKGLPIGIGISLCGSPLFFCLMPGATPNNSDWVRRKSAVVTLFHHSSLYMNTACEVKGVTLFARYGLDPRDYASSGGAVPIFIQGVGCIGAAAVSGLTQYEDHNLVVAAMREILTAG